MAVSPSAPTRRASSPWSPLLGPFQRYSPPPNRARQAPSGQRRPVISGVRDSSRVTMDELKRLAAARALAGVRDGMTLGLAATQRAMATAFAESGVSGQMVVRKGGEGHFFVTDGGHWIVDAHLGRIEDAPHLAGLLSAIPGVVEHGLFIDLASTAVLAGAQGIRVVERR